MLRDSATLEDVYRLALPPETRILVGAEHLRRPVSWACSLRPSPPAFPNLTGNELALVDMDDLRQLDSRMRLDRVVQSLRQARVSAIAVRGPVADNTVVVAEQEGMPLFHLPESVSLLEIERTIIRLIVDREGYIAARAADLQRELTQIELEGGGLATVAHRLHTFAQQPALFLREDGQLSALAGLEHLPEHQRHRLLAGIPNPTTLRTWAASQRAENLGRAVGIIKMADPTYPQAVISAIIAGDRLQGYFLLLRSGEQVSGDPTTVETLAARQGADTAALEWSRQNAVGELRERMQAAFVDDLLANEVADEQAWVQRGDSLGYDLTRPHTAWLVDVQDGSEWQGTLAQFLNGRKEAIPISRRGEGVLLFWPGDNPKSGRNFKTEASELVGQLLAAAPRAQIIIGIGRPAVSPSEWLRSLQQARESWHMGKSWQASPVTYFGDLGLYQLLTALSSNPEAARFFRKTIRPLIEHDENRNAELVDTLDAFFYCHGNLSQTAVRLHIHRNTLTYRLERIASITRLDLNDPDARFSLQLALKLRLVLRGNRSF
ncbi:MAG: helix-turn-helix domain-containing protein [Caldilineaceae bacterium]|nr:helix-turn-helix domain-containing protein [Caldilineaceae bacterium]